MSRLTNPGLGDICDRLTILALKILHAVETGREAQHWETERATLLAQVRSRELNGPWFENLLELAAVNANLWQTEDEVRDWRQQTRGTLDEQQAVTIARLAFRTQALNDRRAEMVHAINKAAGDERGMEKQR